MVLTFQIGIGCRADKEPENLENPHFLNTFLKVGKRHDF